MFGNMLRITTFVCLVACSLAAPWPWAPRGELGRPQPRLQRLQQLERQGSRIVGGDAVDIEDFPYQLSLEFSLMHSCGAAIISPNWAITAAHCTDGSFAFMLRLRAGSTTREWGGTTHLVKRFREHPSFNYHNKDYDVSLLQVSKEFTYTAGVQPIALARATPAPGTVLTVSGWGARRENAVLSPRKLQAVQVPVVEHADCEEAYYKYTVSESMLCAGYPEGGKDACQGDSGGPLVANGELVGIVSWGVGCARADYPGVNADVSVVRDWVLETTGIEE